MIRKVGLLVLVCALSSWLVVRLETRALDLFFLDWKQIILNRTPPDVSIRILDLSNLKESDQNKESFNVIPLDRLKQTLDNTFSQNPKVVFFAISKRELDGTQTQVCDLLDSYPKLYLLTHAVPDSIDILPCYEHIKNFSRRVPLQLTQDQAIDNVPRRMITYYDYQRVMAESSFDELKKLLGTGHGADYFKYDFKYLETYQVFLKIWPFFDYQRISIRSADEVRDLRADIEDKIVIIDAKGIRAFLSAPSMLRRLPWVGLDSMEYRYQPMGNLISTYVTNMVSGEYVKEPSQEVQIAWVFFGLLSVMGAAVLFPVVQAMIASVGFLLLYAFLSGITFWIFSFNLDIGKTFVVGGVGQYLILTVRYIRRIRSLDKEKFQRQQELSEEKLKHQLLLKAAISESTLRTVGKMSHDIRSPLTALNIAAGLLKGKVSEDLRDLIVGASQRIEGISADLLQGYKSKNISRVNDTLPLAETLYSLLNSYQIVDTSFQYQLEVDPSVRLPIPEIIIQRAFSNMINNSIEACRAVGEPCHISISSKVEGGFLDLAISDNGPGIPKTLLPKLFSEGATQGKADGHGLGLYQVKSDLEKWGARVAYIESSRGAVFKISLPLEPFDIRFKVSGSICLISEESPNLVHLGDAGFSVKSFADFSEARQWLSRQSLDVITLIADLTPVGSEESGLEFLDSFGQKSPFYKAIFISSLSDNLKIQELLNRREAVLVSRNSLLNIQFVKDDK